MLDFNRSAPQANTNASTSSAAGTSRADLPKANGWLNFGYTVEIGADAEGNEETRFVSLPVGIPLDTMEPLTINSRNQEFAQFQAARNDLLDQLKIVLGTMAPGEERILCVDGTTGLSVQLRRINDPAAVPAADASNKFAIKLAI